MWEMFLIFSLGIVIGGAGGLLGVGGGVLATPLLALVFGMPQQLAQGTAAVMVVPNVLIGLWRNYQLGHLNWKYVGVMVGGAVLFAWLGAMAALGVSPAHLRSAFAWFLLALSAWLFLRDVLAKTQGNTTGLPFGWSSLVGVLGGWLTGFFGVGGAIAAPPILTWQFGMRQAKAQAHALAMAAPCTVIGLATYAIHHQSNLHFGIPLALGGALSVSWGVRLANRLPDRTLRLLFAGLMAFTAALLLALH